LVRPRPSRVRLPGRAAKHLRCGRCLLARRWDRRAGPRGRGSGRWYGARRWWDLL